MADDLMAATSAGQIQGDSLLIGQLDLRSPAAQRLGVEPDLVAAIETGHHHAVAMAVEEGERETEGGALAPVGREVD